jgi:hypothetical protein
MAIEVLSSTKQPEIEYNRIHLVRLDIRQQYQDNENSPSIYELKIRFQYYGTEPDGTRHYKDAGVQQIVVKDFLSIAAKMAEQGDLTFANAFGVVQQALAKIIEYETGVSSTVI